MNGVLRQALGTLGVFSTGLAFEAGGISLVFWRSLRAIVTARVDYTEFKRSMLSFGEASTPVVMATAAFTGMIMVLQSAVYVEQFGVYNLVGWFTGFTTFRELGPVLMALMFSGRVGANNASELGTMKVNEQLDALRILALDVDELLVAPRTVSMVISLVVLVAVGDLVAVGAGAICAQVLMGVDPMVFIRSLVEGVAPEDFTLGLWKAAVFGWIIAVVSTHFGMTARGGATGVGRAVNAQVVGCAVVIFVADYLMTSAVH